MKKKLLVVLMCLINFAFAGAEDFYENELLFNIIGNREVEVVGGYEGDFFNGVVKIPEYITPDGVSYKVVSIKEYAFSSFYSIISVTIPSSVKNIKEGAFSECFGLTSITISNGVEYIEAAAFSGCEKITSVTIPVSVKEFLEAFWGCNSLVSFNIDKNNPYYSSADGVVFNKDKTQLLLCPNGKSGSYTIPNSAKGIGESAFFACKNLTSIVIPNSVISIGRNAFGYCTNLTSINIPQGVSEIEDYVFWGCKSLGSVILHDDITRFGFGVFRDCEKLESITLPKNLRVIQYYTFWNTGLSSITLPVNFVGVRGSAFAFSKNFMDFFVEEGNQNFCAHEGILYNKDMTAVCSFAYGRTDCVVPEGVLRIDDQVFEAHENLKSISLPSSLTTIGWFSFSGCKNLESLTIPSSVTTIERGAFPSLSEVKVEWKIPLILNSSDDVFDYSNIENGTLIVPYGTKQLYEIAEVWKDFGTIVEEEEKPTIEINENEPAGENGQGTIDVSFNIPSDESFEGTFIVELPDGFILNLNLTALAKELRNDYTLSITPLENNNWEISILPKSLRAANDYEYQSIVKLVYDIDDSVDDGAYQAIISNLHFDFENGYSISHDHIDLNLTVDHTYVGIDEIDYYSIAYIHDKSLHINTSISEEIGIYTVTGTQLKRVFKQAGMEIIPLENISSQILIVKGGSGWTRKLIKR